MNIDLSQIALNWSDPKDQPNEYQEARYSSELAFEIHKSGAYYVAECFIGQDIEMCYIFISTRKTTEQEVKADCLNYLIKLLTPISQL